jgi:predicted ATP-binding protein involved in virulence
MSFTIKKMVLHNRAPFEHIELSFASKGITILNSVNGGGKTTILSYIADAWYEMIRKAYPSEFEGKENKYYRFSSDMFSLDDKKHSFVFIKFCIDEKEVDYLDFRKNVNQDEYKKTIPHECSIDFNVIKDNLEKVNHVKYCSEQDINALERIFRNNLITYFPSYRHEQPGYLNDPFRITLDYGLEKNFAGYTINPVEVISNLPGQANWLLDVVLDMAITNNDTTAHVLFNNINDIFSAALSIKPGKTLSIGIGERFRGATRIQIVEIDTSNNWKKTIYPSIFNMSSGESALISLFCELVRQFDRILPNSPIQNATGIILIDEIDKHLHICMQKDVLPKLMLLFPNVQFIISTHSPFIAMGLDSFSKAILRSQVVDLDNQGLVLDISATQVFNEAYNAMIEKNKHFKDMYDVLKARVESSRLQIVTEGKNVEHIERAIEVIDDTLLDRIESCFNDKTGCKQLKNAYETIALSSPQAKYLFVFDCDCIDSVEDLVENDNFFRFVFAKNVNNSKVKKGIENLYPPELFTDDYYQEKETFDEYGAKKTIQEFDKNAFLNAIRKDTEATHFANYQPLVNRINEILSRARIKEELLSGENEI